MTTTLDRPAFGSDPALTARTGIERDDFGEVADRWSGISSQRVDVGGTSVHLLRADAASVDAHAPVHVVLHGLSASGVFLLDLIARLREHGPVIAPDLPGSVFGLTDTPHPRAARVLPKARFVRALLDTLGIDRVIVHGWSMGAAVALHYAALAPEQVAGVVLATPPLPMPLGERERRAWATRGRAILAGAPALAAGVMRLAGRRLLAYKLRYLDEHPDFLVGLGTTSEEPGGQPDGGIPEDTLGVWKDAIANIAQDPHLLRHTVTAFADVARGVFVDRERTWAAMDAVTAPVLMISGLRDRLIVPAIVTAAAQRHPGWTNHVIPDAGHFLPVQHPARYAAAVHQWQATASPSSCAEGALRLASLAQHRLRDRSRRT